jgi:methionyl-tRNA synthetase
MKLTDAANGFVAEAAPWVVAKDESRDAELHQICSDALEMFRILTIYLKPVLPKIAQEIEAFLNVPTLTWTQVQIGLSAFGLS